VNFVEIIELTPSPMSKRMRSEPTVEADDDWMPLPHLPMRRRMKVTEVVKAAVPTSKATVTTRATFEVADLMVLMFRCLNNRDRSSLASVCKTTSEASRLPDALPWNMDRSLVTLVPEMRLHEVKLVYRTPAHAETVAISHFCYDRENYFSCRSTMSLNIQPKEDMIFTRLFEGSKRSLRSLTICDKVQLSVGQLDQLDNWAPNLEYLSVSNSKVLAILARLVTSEVVTLPKLERISIFMACDACGVAAAAIIDKLSLPLHLDFTGFENLSRSINTSVREAHSRTFCRRVDYQGRSRR
jgi:hypothetical protein